MSIIFEICFDKIIVKAKLKCPKASKVEMS
jgi:hypothetical protein